MKGFVVFYVNLATLEESQVKNVTDLIMRTNAQIIERIRKENDYDIMIVPTTGEACHVDKMDLEMTKQGCEAL